MSWRDLDPESRAFIFAQLKYISENPRQAPQPLEAGRRKKKTSEAQKAKEAAQLRAEEEDAIAHPSPPRALTGVVAELQEVARRHLRSDLDLLWTYRTDVSPLCSFL